jgi:hypothetical protein
MLETHRFEKRARANSLLPKPRARDGGWNAAREDPDSREGGRYASSAILGKTARRSPSSLDFTRSPVSITSAWESG